MSPRLWPIFCRLPAATFPASPWGSMATSRRCEAGRARSSERDRRSHEQVVALPVESTTSLTFESPGLDVAFFTSIAHAVRGVKPKEREADALFAVQCLGMRGLPEPRSRVQKIRSQKRMKK